MNIPKNQSKWQRAVIYIYGGVTQQEFTEAAIDRQRQACEQRAAELGVDIVKEYVHHGRNTGPKPQLTRMLAELKLKRVDVVIAYDHAQISLLLREYNATVAKIQAAGAELVVTTVPQFQYQEVYDRLALSAWRRTEAQRND